MSTPKNIPPDQFRPGDMLELALSIFNSNEPPLRSLEQIRFDRLRRRREREHRRLVSEAAQRRAERREHKDRFQKASMTTGMSLQGHSASRQGQRTTRENL